MILVGEGLIGLNRPVQEYIPEFVGEGKDQVMVHHLLTHTSGMRSEEPEAHAEARKGSIDVPPPDTNQHPLIHEMLFSRYDAPLWKAPGEEMTYCDHNFRTLGEVIRRVSGKHHSDFIGERIFSPLGMKDTHFTTPREKCRRIVRRPAHLSEAVMDDPSWFDVPSASDGPNHSTAMDIAIFGQMFLNDGNYGDVRIMSPATVAKRRAIKSPESEPDTRARSSRRPRGDKVGASTAPSGALRCPVPSRVLRALKCGRRLSLG
jgi:CubicO group peptidase (beta-lactamase class C family)